MRSIMLLIVGAAVSCWGCQSSASTSTAPAGDAASTKLKKARDEYVAALQKEMQNADQDLDELRKKAVAASGDTKVAMEKKIKELESHRADVHVNFEKIKAESHEAFEELKTGMNRSWKALKDSIEKTKEEYK